MKTYKHKRDGVFALLSGAALIVIFIYVCTGCQPLPLEKVDVDNTIYLQVVTDSTKTSTIHTLK